MTEVPPTITPVRLPEVAVVLPGNPTRDVARTIADRALYALAMVLVGWLQAHGKLDVTSAALILALTGLRPHNLATAITERTARPLVSGGA